MDPNVTLQNLIDGDQDAGADLAAWLIDGGFPPAVEATSSDGTTMLGYVTQVRASVDGWCVLVTSVHGFTGWFHPEQVTASEKPSRNQPLTFWCPNCQAPRDTPCNVPTETGRRDVSWFHTARIDLAYQGV